MHAIADKSMIPESLKEHEVELSKTEVSPAPAGGYTAVGTAIAKWVQSMSVAPVPAQHT